MEDASHRHLRDLYGLNPDIPHVALQFPRLPPSLSHPMFKIHDRQTTERLSKESSASHMLQDFQHAYRQHAAGLLMADHAAIPPGHPLHARQNSVDVLRAENDRLLKENMDLKKKLDHTSEKESS